MRSFLAACLVLLFASSAHAQMYGSDLGLSFTPTVQNAAYSSGNSLGGLQTVAILRAPLSSGIFDSLSIISKGGSTTAMTVYLFDTNPSGSTCTDKNAFVLAAADISKLAMAPFVLTPAIVGVGTTATIAQLTQVVSIRNQDSPSTNNVYICIVAGGTVTPASTTDLVAKISAAQD